MEGIKKSILLCMIFCSAWVSGIVNINLEKKQKIDEFVNSLLFNCERHKNTVGMNLAVVYQGEILYTTGYGVRSLGKSNSFCL